MNCKLCQRLLDSCIAGQPSATLQAHLATCTACSRYWRRQRQIRQTLASVPAASPPPDFTRRVLSAAFTGIQRRRRRTLAALGLAASLVLTLGLSLGVARLGMQHPGYQVSGGELLLPSETATTVQLAFDAGDTLHHVQFTLALPEGVEVRGYPQARHLRWQGELRKGRNLIQLPMIAHAGAHGALVAHLHHGDSERTFRLLLSSVPRGPFWRRWLDFRL